MREITGKPVGIKTVIGQSGWLDQLATEINRRGIESAPDFITVDGAEGGTGAAPQPLIDMVGPVAARGAAGGGRQAHRIRAARGVRVIASGR